MITIKDAEEILKKEYHIDNFLYLINDILLPDFKSTTLYSGIIYLKV